MSFPDNNSSNTDNTRMLVGILVIVVAGFFVSFTLIAVCYRCVKIESSSNMLPTHVSNPHLHDYRVCLGAGEVGQHREGGKME